MGRGIDCVKGREWEERLWRYADSQLTSDAFCACEGVSVAAFYVWRKKLSGGRHGRCVTDNLAAARVAARPSGPLSCRSLLQGRVCSVEQQPEEQGWAPVTGVTLQMGMFIGKVSGRSMEPRIPDESWCVFRPCPTGSREGRLLLVQLRTAASDKHGGRFTIKRYHSERQQTPDGWQHKSIQLQALNPVLTLWPARRRPNPAPKQIPEPTTTPTQSTLACNHPGAAPAPTAHMSLLYGYL